MLAPRFARELKRKILAKLYANNTGTSVATQLLDGAALRLDNIGFTVIPVVGDVTPSMTRATEKRIVDSWGRQVVCKAGEVAFPGARRVENLWGTTSTTLADTANNSMTLAAGTYIFSMGVGSGTATFSGTGGATGTLAASASGRVSVTKTITAGTLVVTASVADLTDLQVEDRTGCSDTTTPSEYVSVGSLDYRSDLNQLYYTQPATASHYASTPNATANQIAGDKTIIMRGLQLGSVAPAGYLALTDRSAAATPYGYGLFQDTGASGKLAYFHGTGASVRTALSSVTLASVGITTMMRIGLAVTHNTTTGVVKFWYKLPTSTIWVQLGADVASTAGDTDLSTESLGVFGRPTNPTLYNNNAQVQRVELYSGVVTDLDAGTGGTLAQEFYPHRDATVMQTRTNYITLSNTLSSWTPLGSPTITQDETGPDGQSNYAWSIVDDSAISYYGVQILPAFSSGAIGCFSTLLKKQSGSPVYPLVLFYYNNAAGAATGVVVDEVAGTLSVLTGGGYTAPTTYGIESYSDDFWLVYCSQTQAGATLTARCELYAAGSLDGVNFSAAGQGTSVFCDAQFEQGVSYPTDRITTTGAARTVYADWDSSTTGEHWEVNGSSSTIRSAAYHGSMVDGVKCFPTDLEGNALPTRATYEAVSLPGVAGSYVSTPDSDANSITGDMAVVSKLSLVDWTPASADVCLAAKWDTSVGGTRSWILVVDATTGKLHFYWTTDGSTTVTTGVSTVAPTVADGAALTVGVSLDVNNGAGGYDLKFWTSTDSGNTWSQLGSTIVGGAPTSIYDANTYPLTIGGDNDGSAVILSGKIYSTQLYNGIPPIFGGTGSASPVVSFDASRYEGGSTLTGSTGETWTLNGNAVIHKTNNPMTTPLIELAATNETLKSQTFNDAAWTVATASATQNALGADGGSATGWTISSTGGSLQERGQDHTLTAANWTDSYLVKKTTGAQTTYPVIYVSRAGPGVALATLDTTNGVATVWTACTGFSIITSSARCSEYNSDYWLFELTYLATAAAHSLRIVPAGADTATKSTGTVHTATAGSCVVFDAQRELGSKATSRIRNTNAAADATRNADQLYYTSGSGLIASLKTIAVVDFKRESGVTGVAATVALTDGTANTYAEHYFSNVTATESRFGGAISGVIQWNTIASNTYVSGTLSNVAWSQATNDIKMAKDGVAQTADTTATIPTVSRLEYGMAAGAFQLNGYPGKVYGWTRNLSQSELNAVTK